MDQKFAKNNIMVKNKKSVSPTSSSLPKVLKRTFSKLRSKPSSSKSSVKDICAKRCYSRKVAEAFNDKDIQFDTNQENEYMQMNKLKDKLNTNEATMVLVGETIGARSYSTGHLEQEEYQITLLKDKKENTNRILKKGNKITKMNIFYFILKSNSWRIFPMTRIK